MAFIQTPRKPRIFNPRTNGRSDQTVFSKRKSEGFNPRMFIPDHIFRGYDIRGVSGKDLTPQLFSTLGRGYATFIKKRGMENKCVVGMDIRETSQIYKEAFVKGLLDSGVNVIDLGLTLAPIVYFAQYHYQSKAAAMITASHNPREFNGLKLAVGYSETMVSEEIQELKEILESGEFKRWPASGTLKEENVFPAYKEELFKRVPIHDSGLKVVIDSSKATTGAFLPEILREAGCSVVEQNTNLDATFPLGTPDPTDATVLGRLAKTVKEEKADLGVSYDSDGDRMGIVDEGGTLIWNDVLVALFAQDILRLLPGNPIVFNVLCSKTVSDTIAAAGGKPVIWKTGHSFIKAKVKELKAPFGGELSGHFFFLDNFYGHDDATFATLKLLSYLKKAGQSLKQAVGKLPKYFSSPEIKLGLADEIKFKVVSEQIAPELKRLFPTASYIEIDGIRVDTQGEMVVIRASQNGPYATIRFEARTKEQYNVLKKTVSELLRKYKEIDLENGVNVAALE